MRKRVVWIMAVAVFLFCADIAVAGGDPVLPRVPSLTVDAAASYGVATIDVPFRVYTAFVWTPDIATTATVSIGPEGLSGVYIEKGKALTVNNSTAITSLANTYWSNRLVWRVDTASALGTAATWYLILF